MNKVNDFTAEEQQLISLFGRKDNRASLIRAILTEKGYDAEAERVAVTAAEKLAAISDTDYADTFFEDAI